MTIPIGTFGRWENEQQRYDVLDAYRSSQDLYGRLRNELQLKRYAGYQNVRNPANRLIELYTAKLTDSLLEHLDTSSATEESEQPDTEPGTELETQGLAPEVLKGLILKIHEWSNWEDRVEVAGRNFPTHGDLFIKVEPSEDRQRVQLNLLDPRVVQDDFQTDARGFFTYLRLDIPQEERDPNEEDEVRQYTRTEIWDKDAGQYLVFEHEEDPGADLDDLGTPVFSALLTSKKPDRPNVEWTGTDFIPVVHRKLRDVGEDRGEGAFEHALDGIDTANWLATKLFAMLFPKITWKGTRQPGPGGTMLGPFKLETEDEDDEALSRLTAPEEESYRVIEVSGERTLMLPAGADMQPMVPGIDFKSHLDALDAHLKELEKDLPELAYYRLRDMTEISGVAARILLGDVIDRLGKARAKFEDAHVRAHKMALTIGQVMKVPGFEVIPENAYEDGLLEHGFKTYDLFPLSELEKATVNKAESEALAGYKELGAAIYAKKLKEAGLADTDEEALAIANEATTQPPSLTEQLLGNTFTNAPNNLTQ